jgi:5-methylcytosine-specific restriction endonuclease McrBC regulatory subunit McrC
MQRYKRPHALAKMVLKRLRTDAQGNISDKKAETVPFYLNMWRLFELYVGVLLEKAGHIFEPQENYQLDFENKAGPVTIRPDYVSLSAGIVVDSKYKCITNEVLKNDESKLDLVGFADTVKPSNADMYQLIAYSAILSKWKGKQFNKAIIMAPGIPGKHYQENFPELSDLEKLGTKLILCGNVELIIIPCPVPARHPER